MICPNCGGIHGGFHSGIRLKGSACELLNGFVAPTSVSAADRLTTANSNFAPVVATTRRRLSVAESIARNKAKFAETLAFLK